MRETLFVSPTSPGMSSELMHLFLATGLTRVGPGGGVASEDIRTHLVPLTEIRSWIDDRQNEGTTVDFKIHAALWAAQPFLPDNSSPPSDSL
jgi:ADP-ribose pyrophosphatase